MRGQIKKTVKTVFWFLTGVSLGLFFFISFVFIIFQKMHIAVVFPGVMVNGVNFGNKTEDQVKDFFVEKNKKIEKTQFVFVLDDKIATISADQIEFGYDEDLLSHQAFSIGRSNQLLSNISLVFQAYLNGINLSPAYRFSDPKLTKLLSPITQDLNISPVDALFNFQNGKVTAFRPSSDGQEVDIQAIEDDLLSKAPKVLSSANPQIITIPIQIKVLKPKVTTDKANSMGIKEIIGTGTSLFQHSIPNRVYNVTLAATRLNGILVAPGEVFSFGNALGDVSAFTGYKQAYVIQNGRTVLGDGGGVCQVSTTFFRAILNAGLPVLERHAHDYRVGYYEQDSPPGIDATVFLPTVDLKFKNDTKNYILIQSFIDPEVERLTFVLYGTKDGRKVSMSKPVITSQTPPPPTLYQDDSTLPKGVLQQVDFEAWGANVFFTRDVTKDGKVIISDKFVSNYRPWQAIFLRGTKE